MPSKLTRTTTDHEEIRRWAEERGAAPAEVEGTERGGDMGMIRLDFPGYSGAGSLKHVSWDEWFEKFDQSNLALVYQERTARGQPSNFNKLVARETAEARAGGDNEASRRNLRRGGGGARRSTRARSGASATRTSRSGRRRGKAAARGSSRTGAGRGAQRTGRQAAARSGRTGRSSRSAGTREAPRSIVARLTGRGRMPATEGGSRRRTTSSRVGRGTGSRASSRSSRSSARTSSRAGGRSTRSRGGRRR